MKKRNTTIKKFLAKAAKLIIPSDMSEKISGLSRQQIEALNDTSTISNLLMHSHYEQRASGQRELGIYTMRTGRRGFILEITPPPFLGEKIQDTISNYIGSLVGEDIVVGITSYASSNIHEEMERFEGCHPCDVKIEHPEVLSDLLKERKNEFLRMTKDSICGEDADLRIRKFYNLIWVLFPEETKTSDIVNAFNNARGSLDSLNPRNFSADKLLVLLHEILKPDAEAITRKEADTYRKLNSQFARGVDISLQEGVSDFQIGQKKKVIARTFTTQKFPKKVSLGESQTAFFDPLGANFQIALPCRFLVSLVIHIDRMKQMREKATTKARYNIKNNARLSTNLRDRYPELEEVHKESLQTVKYIEEMGETPMHAMWSMTIFEENQDRLGQWSGAIKKRFREVPTIWEIEEETFPNVALLSMIYSLPLQFYEPMKNVLGRFDILFKTNNAQIAPLISDYRGFGEYNNIYVGRTGQILRMDPFASELNYNTVVVGPPGSGKSTWAQDYLYSALGCGWRVWMFDLGDSYKNLCEEIGGQYLKFQEGAGICLNFFTFINTTKIFTEKNDVEIQGVRLSIGSVKQNNEYELPHEDEFETIVPMIGMMCGVDLRSTSNYEKGAADSILQKNTAQIIEGAIRIAFLRHGRKAGMVDVFAAISEIYKAARANGNGVSATICEGLFVALEPYANTSGKFFSYFNGVFNINMDNWFFILEQEELKNKGELRDVVVYGMLQRIAQLSFLAENRTYKKLIAFDESAPLLSNPLFVHAFDDFSRRIRKYAGALMLITQNISDFFVNNKASAVFTNASYRILLEQDPSEVEKAVDSGNFPLNDFEKALLLSVKKRPYFSEFMIQHRGMSAVARLKVTTTELALFSTKHDDRILKERLRKKYDLGHSDALFVLSRVMAGYSEDESIRLLGNRNQKIREQYWKEKILTALMKNKIEPFAQPIVDADGGVYAYELLMRLRDEQDQVYSPKQFGHIAQQHGLSSDLARRFAERAFAEYSKYQMNFSINLDEHEIRDETLWDFFQNKIHQHSANGHIIFELNFNEMGEQMIKFAKKMKSIGARIAIDKVNLRNINLHKLLRINPDIIKLDSELIKNLSKDKMAIEETKMIKIISDKLETEVVAVHVSNQEMFETSKEAGIRFFQGHYIKHPLNSEELAMLEGGRGDF